jgi:hypothetical protein
VFRENTTCVAVYAIARGVTWPFTHNVLATSRRLDVTSEDSSSLQAEDGDAKNRRKAYVIHHGHVSDVTGIYEYDQTYAYQKRPLLQRFQDD